MDEPPKTKCKRRTEYHDALTDIFNNLMPDPVRNGDVEIGDERRLSKAPLKIDLVITKKNPAAEITSRVCRIFRAHNIVEYKSPAADTLAMKDFNKTLGYASIYAWEKEISITDMTATIICFKKPAELFETLSKNLAYKVLRKYPGIYYISYRGVSAEKMLGIQIIFSPELPESEFVLKVIGMKLDSRMAKKAWRYYNKNQEKLKFWWGVMLQNNDNNNLFYKEINMARMSGWAKLLKRAEKDGLLAEYEQEWEQKGMQKGRQEERLKILELLEKGYSTEEVKIKLKLA